jgi:hypothetical protein
MRSKPLRHRAPRRLRPRFATMESRPPATRSPCPYALDQITSDRLP